MKTHFSQVQLWTKETTNHWHEGCDFLLQGLQNELIFSLSMAY